MPNRNPFKLPYTRGLPRMDNMKRALKEGSTRPPIGVTQGGSSRKAKGAKVAATTAQLRQTKTGE